MGQNSGQVVVVVGLGYVGLPLALRAQKQGYQVIGLDLDQEKVAKLNSKIAVFEDEMVEKMLEDTGVEFDTDLSRLKEADVAIICVPTPVDAKRQPDYGPVEKATISVGKYMKKGVLVVLESTVNPGVCDELVVPILERESGMKIGVDFGVAHCPERINPGDKKWNVSNIARVVGGNDDAACERAFEFYSSIVEAPIKKMKSLKEAEAVKVVENSFRNVNIAFVNELAQAFDKIGIDVKNVIDGAATKPFAFMPHYPGVGVGGHCIPVDPYYLMEYSKRKSGFEHHLLATAMHINESMPAYTVGMLESELNKIGKNMAGSKIAVLGVAYKKDVDDTRESPAYEVIEDLHKKGASVRVFDPHVPRESTVESIDEALEGADGVVLVTGHSEFKKMEAIKLKQLGVKVMVDGGNVLNRSDFEKQGLVYRGIGR